jgi:hypothetical protein
MNLGNYLELSQRGIVICVLYYATISGISAPNSPTPDAIENSLDSTTPQSSFDEEAKIKSDEQDGDSSLDQVRANLEEKLLVDAEKTAILDSISGGDSKATHVEVNIIMNKN